MQNGGKDGGMTPPELLLAALGTCAGFYAAQYLNARSLPAQALQIKVSAEKATHPARLDRFHIEVIAPGITAQHETGLQRAVHACLIHNTLLNTPTIDISIRSEEPASVL
jgi:uncharacterized OsmC-like protein